MILLAAAISLLLTQNVQSISEPIVWDSHSGPMIQTSIPHDPNGPTYRLLDTCASRVSIEVHDPEASEPTEVQSSIQFHTMHMGFFASVLYTSSTNTTQIFPMSRLSRYARVQGLSAWFFISPRSFFSYLDSPGSMIPLHCNVRTEDPQTVDLVPDERDWKLMLVGGQELVIDSASLDIHLPETTANAILDEARVALRDADVNFYQAEGNEILIHDCNIAQLDEVLPVLEFSFTNTDGQTFAISLSGREYLRPYASSHTVCRIGIVPTDTGSSTVRLGSSVFRKYIVGLNHSENKVFFCRARDPLHA